MVAFFIVFSIEFQLDLTHTEAECGGIIATGDAAMSPHTAFHFAVVSISNGDNSPFIKTSASASPKLIATITALLPLLLEKARTSSESRLEKMG